MPSSDSGQFEIEWPARWQREAIEAVLPHLGSDERLRILLDDPKKAIHGTLRVTSSEKVEIAGSRLGGMINLTNYTAEERAALMDALREIIPR
jgi:hypothetical protein